MHFFNTGSFLFCHFNHYQKNVVVFHQEAERWKTFQRVWNFLVFCFYLLCFKRWINKRMENIFRAFKNNFKFSCFCLVLKGEKHEEQVIELARTEMIPMQPTYLSFWQKFLELQLKMVMIIEDPQSEHKYSSSPLDWPLMKRNVAYWLSDTSNVSSGKIWHVIWYDITYSMWYHMRLYYDMMTWYMWHDMIYL